MSTKVFLSIAAALLLLLGAGWLFFPEVMLGRWGVQSDGVGVYMGRRYGGIVLGYVVILWLARGAAPSQARSAILAGGGFVAALMALVSVMGIVSGTIGSGGWVSVGIEALLAAGFVFHLVAGRAQLQRSAG